MLWWGSPIRYPFVCRLCTHSGRGPLSWLTAASSTYQSIQADTCFWILAGIEWLLDKFKSYIILRDRVLSDTSILRDKLHVAVPEVSNGNSNAGWSFKSIWPTSSLALPPPPPPLPHISSPGHLALKTRRCQNSLRNVASDLVAVFAATQFQDLLTIA